MTQPLTATGGSAPLRPPRAILFDWDNTLVDSWATIHEALNFLMQAMDKPLWTLAETRARAQRSLTHNFPMLFGDRWEEARDIYLGRFREIHLERLRPLPGRTEMLRALAGGDVFLGVISNKTGELLRREVAGLGWAELFGSVVGAGDAAADKPACEAVHLALAPSGVSAGEEVWLVGDAPVDMECARNSGCIGVLLGEGASSQEFTAFAPHLSFADEVGLFRLLQGLRSQFARPIS